MWVRANVLSEATTFESSATVSSYILFGSYVYINSAPAVKTTVCYTKLLQDLCTVVCYSAPILSCKGHLSVWVAINISRFYFLAVLPESLSSETFCVRYNQK